MVEKTTLSCQSAVINLNTLHVRTERICSPSNFVSLSQYKKHILETHNTPSGSTSNSGSEVPLPPKRDHGRSSMDKYVDFIGTYYNAPRELQGGGMSRGGGTKQADSVGCLKCRNGSGGAVDDAQLLRCVSCLARYHTYCVRPKVRERPMGDWYCHSCKKKDKHLVPVVTTGEIDQGLLGSLSIERFSALDRLISPVQRVLTFENWSSREVGVFEAGICVHGKKFAILSKLIKTKSTKEVIRFYYLWKKSSHYVKWKSSWKRSKK